MRHLASCMRESTVKQRRGPKTSHRANPGSHLVAWWKKSPQIGKRRLQLKPCHVGNLRLISARQDTAAEDDQLGGFQVAPHSDHQTKLVSMWHRTISTRMCLAWHSPRAAYITAARYYGGEELGSSRRGALVKDSV